MKEFKALIVDDFIINRILIREILHEFRCELAEAQNGKVAIEKLRRGFFDILFIDLEMPVMNGLETTIFIRNEFSPPQNKIPIIAITAHDTSLYFDHYEKAGFNGLITKPYSYYQIQTIVKGYFDDID